MRFLCYMVYSLRKSQIQQIFDVSSLTPEIELGVVIGNAMVFFGKHLVGEGGKVGVGLAVGDVAGGDGAHGVDEEDTAVWHTHCFVRKHVAGTVAKGGIVGVEVGRKELLQNLQTFDFELFGFALDDLSAGEQDKTRREGSPHEKKKEANDRGT